VAADVVGLAHHPFGHHFKQGAGVVLDEQPVTHLQAVAVYRQRFTGQGVEDHQRDQFFGEVERPVVVRAVGQQYRQPVGAVPGADQVVGRCLAGRIRRAWRVGRGLGEQVVDAVQVAIHFVGGNMVEAEGAFFRLGQGQPVGAGSFEQAVGTDDIGLDKVRRPVDGTVNVGLGRQVHDRLGLETRNDRADRRLIDDISLHELVAGIGGNALQRFQVTGVGQLVEVEDFVPGIFDQVTDQR